MKLKTAIIKLRFYLSFLLLGFYLTVGFILLFTDVWADLIPKGRALIGLLLILFGGIRFYVSYTLYIKKTLRLKEKEESRQDASE